MFWSTGFLRYDGNFLKNAGYYKIKRELRVGEAEGERRSRSSQSRSSLKIDEISNQDVCITAENKGNVVVSVKDDTGKEEEVETRKYCMKIRTIYQMYQKMI